MGFQTDLGAIESFQQAQKQQKSLKIMGIKQFLHRLALYSEWTKPNEPFNIKWGEEIEGHFLKIGENGDVELFKESFSEQYQGLDFPLMLEYGSWMFEMIPQQPYNTSCNFYQIVHSIRHKYRVLATKPRIALTIPVIPFIGVKDSQQKISSPLTKSLYIDDDHVAPHPRFLTHTNTITSRRGGPIDIRLPIFKDTNTTAEQLSKTEPDAEYIHMDAVAFGMGNCCLQCTFSTKDFNHARYMYDQLNVLSPIMLAMTAGSPFYKGKISDWDIRWKALCDSVDDRTPSERDPNSPDFLPNSRCSEASYYLWNNQANRPEYNDFYTGATEEDVERVRQLGKQENVKLDQRMAFHIANIFKRDYLIVYENYKHMTKEEFVLCEMLNGTNWNSVRLKIPLDDNIGWRVEFRTMEVQLTADENSAYSLFIHLVTRLLHADPTLNFYIPISQLRENFNRAHQRDALRTQRFFFRTNIHDSGAPIIEELSVAEILFGKGSFAGIFREIESRVQVCTLSCESVGEVIARVKQFLFDTATGNRLTLAQWMRRYVNDHPEYCHNSVLSRRVMSDLLLHLHKISIGAIDDPNFRPIFPSYGECSEKKLSELFQREQVIVGGCCNNIHWW